MPSFINLVFLVSFSTLSLWLLFKDNKEIRKYFGTAFVVSFLYYVAYYLLFPGFLGYFKLALGVVLLFAGGFILNAFSSNKILFVLLLGAALFGIWHLPEIPRIPFINSSPKSSIKGIDPKFELLVEMKPGKNADDIKSIIKKYNLQYETAFNVKNGDLTDLDDFIVINIPDKNMIDYDLIIKDLSESGKVDGIEQNEIVTLFQPVKSEKLKRGKSSSVLNDPLLDKVWSLEILQFDTLHRFLAQKNIKPLKKAKIAIIDTGVDGNHQDLNDNYTSTRAEYDEDPQGHGTHCAGIAAAVTNNNKGIASFTPSNNFVEITSIQVFPRKGGTTQRTIIRGMILAIDSGADVLSMSLGGPSNDGAQLAYKAAVAYASRKGVIIVAAAGNEDVDATEKVPASVDGVIAVAAVDKENRKASFSNDLSKIKWALAAPGVNIFSTMPGSEYDFMSGTSMSTPYVAGIIGLMKSIYPTLDAEKAFNILNKSGIITLSGKKTGKLIQPLSAIKELLYNQ